MSKMKLDGAGKSDAKTLKPVDTLDIVNAIESLVHYKILQQKDANSHGAVGSSAFGEQIELCRRTIADGLRYHSASRGVIAGSQD